MLFFNGRYIDYLSLTYATNKNRIIINTILNKKKTFKKFKIKIGLLIMSKCKGKAVPLQAWSGPEGSRKLRFPDFMTTAQNGGKVVSLTHRPPLLPGNTPGTHFC